MAAPLVTGTIALVEAAHPTWTMSQVIDAVLDTVTPDPALAGKVTTGGIVNAAAAVANTDGPLRRLLSRPSARSTAAAGLGRCQVTFNEEINPATFTASQVSLTGPERHHRRGDRRGGRRLERPRVHHLVPRARPPPAPTP